MVSEKCDLAIQTWNLILSEGTGGQFERESGQRKCQEACGGPCSDAEQERPIICHII